MTNKEAEQNNEAEFMRNKARDLVEEAVDSSPNRLSEINVELTAIKAFFSEKLDNILVFKATKLEEWRVETGSVAGAKSKWNATDEGRNEILLRGIIGRIKDSVSVNKARLNVMHDEAFGQY